MKRVLQLLSGWNAGVLILAIVALAMLLLFGLEAELSTVYSSLAVILISFGIFLFAIKITTDNSKQSDSSSNSLLYEQQQEELTSKKLSAEIESYQQTYDRLSQAEQRLQAIVNLIPQAISVKDQQGKIILANQSYADFFGKRRRDIIGTIDSEIWPENFESERLNTQDKEVIESYQPQTISAWLTNAQQQKRFYKIHKVAVIDPVLDEPVLLGISVDASEDYYREQLLHARSRVLESIVESSPLELTFSLLASEMRIRLDVEEISFVSLNKDILTPIFTSKPDEDSTKTFLADVLTGEQSLSYITRIIKTATKVVCLSVQKILIKEQLSEASNSYLTQNEITSISGRRITDSKDNNIGFILLTHKKTIQNFEKYKKTIDEAVLLAALAVEKKTTEVKLNEFNEVVAKSQSAIFVVNNLGEVISVNDSCCRIFAVAEELLLSSSLLSLQPDGKMGQSYGEMITAIKESESWRNEITICTDDGLCKKFQASVSPSIASNKNSIVILDESISSADEVNQVKPLSFYDALTGLHNRGLLFERLQQILDGCVRNDKQCALILLDLDFFNKVNESLGHANGDEVLRKIASRIVQTVRKEDIVARIDGDEFAIVIEGLQKPEMLRKIANNLMHNISRPIVLQDKKIFPSVSVGIGVGPSDGEKAEDLVRNVSMALYRAKVNGRNLIEFYEFELNRASQDRLNIESEMREGLSNGEFFTMFQPIYSESGTEIVAAEALMRWKNPKRGLVSPMDFIPVAEETGLIKEIGHLVFSHTAKMLKTLGDKAVKIRVNLSARQFEDGKLPKMIEQLLRINELPSELLALELTESLLMEGRLENLHQLEAICGMGISIAIDDFGTGYSSLSYLKTLPVDVLKIDRSFIQELEVEGGEKSLVDIILAVAQKLEMGAIAEGIETPEQLQFLRNLNFKGLQLQGYLLSKPLMAEEFHQLIVDSEQKNSISLNAG